MHSGQHYDDSLSLSFLETYDLPVPEIKLEGVGGASRGHQFAAIIGQLTERFTDDRPAAVVVQGDTNTAAAAAQAASFLDIPVVHVEAGLRSYDRAMPEEINRQLVGVVAELHCAPTEVAADQLRQEGVDPDRILVTGNTVVEATHGEPARCGGSVAAAGSLPPASRTSTCWRPSTARRTPTTLTDCAPSLSLSPGSTFRSSFRCTLVRQDASAKFGLGELLTDLRVVEPVDHPSFLGLAQHARLLVSDSGGVQEECTVLKRPLLVLRNSTERPEAIEAGFARRIVPGPDLPSLLRDAVAEKEWLPSLATKESPYGDGTASARIVRAVEAVLL